MRRRRECTGCGHRFTSFERREREPLFVRKRDGERERFDRTKLRAALLRSTHKRQVSATDVEALVDRVEVAIAAAGGELPAESIGKRCLEGLRELDYGAYLQFLGTLPVPDPAGLAAAPVADARNTDFAASAESSSVRSEDQHASLPPKSAS